MSDANTAAPVAPATETPSAQQTAAAPVSAPVAQTAPAAAPAPAAQPAAQPAATQAAPETPKPAPERRVIPRAAAPATAPAPAAPDPALSAQVTALNGALSALTQSIASTSLPESARAAFAQTYANDPVGAAKALAVIQAGGLAAPRPVPVGANTAPATEAPKPAADLDPDTKAYLRHEELAKTAPILAGNYRLSNLDAIERGKAKAASRN